MERSRYPQRSRFLLRNNDLIGLTFLFQFYQEDIVQRNNSRSYGIVLVCKQLSFFSLPLAHRHGLIEMLARLG
jgi:hypothetical protein